MDVIIKLNQTNAKLENKKMYKGYSVYMPLTHRYLLSLDQLLFLIKSALLIAHVKSEVITCYRKDLRCRDPSLQSKSVDNLLYAP